VIEFVQRTPTPNTVEYGSVFSRAGCIAVMSSTCWTSPMYRCPKIPATATPGPPAAKAEQALTPAARDPRVRALSIGELNPARSAGDPDALPLFADTIARILAVTGRGYPARSLTLGYAEMNTPPGS
jgi:hypothetical protein